MKSKTLLVTAQEMKRFEETVIRGMEIPSLVLMERAGMALLDALPKTGRIAIVCGRDNNGADGVCLARLLGESGRGCSVFFPEEGRQTPELLHQQKRLSQSNFPEIRCFFGQQGTPEDLYAYDVIVDALFGIGLSRPVEGAARAYILAMNACREKGAFVLSVDIPSGVDGTSGKVLGAAVRASRTVTFSLAKTGLVFYPGRELCGELLVAPIGLPAIRESKWYRFTGAPGEFLPERPADSHKGTYGTVAVLAGCQEMPGAATLCTKAAYRSGAGIVRLLSEAAVVETVRQTVPEVIARTLPGELSEEAFQKWMEEELAKASCVAAGPGLGNGPLSRRCLDAVLRCKQPKVLDADAINGLAERLNRQTASLPERLRLLNDWLSPNTVLTPHKKELSRLLGLPVPELRERWLEILLLLHEEIRFVMVLKDACTAVVSAEGIYLNQSGNAGMATGGSGDVLTGILGAFLAVMPPERAAACAVYLHGCLGDEAAKRGGSQSLMASDLIALLPELLP